ncbi:MAG: Uma2 family endonuclease [Desulfuromonadales bacterium]
MPLAKIMTERFTYADYLTWSDDERRELIDGVSYSMSPAPGTRHQRISRSLSLQIGNFLQDKSCELFVAPFDVRLPERHGLTDDKVDTVVQPDLLVVCDKTGLDERGYTGAPELVIEILSQSSAARDIKIKFDLYQRFGVREYWIIHPAEQTLLVYKIAEDGLYGAADRYSSDDTVSVPLFGDLAIHLKDVFAE